MTTHSTTVHPGTDDTVTALARKTAPTASTVPAFRQLIRTPIVPQEVLKRHGAYCAIDTRFRAAARLQQALWLKDQSITTAADDRTTTNPHSFLGSILSADAARAGQNFLTPSIHRLALQEWLLCEDDAAIDSERLFGNALSSMPLVFNLFGPLALDRKLATAVFRTLLPGFIHSVERMHFEHSPGRRNDRYLSDRTAFDLAVHVTTTDRSPAIIYIEVKFSESMEGPVARMRDRYSEASKAVRLYRDPDSAILRSLAIEQLWREHMTAQLAVDHEVTPRAIFMAIGPRLNRRVQAAFRVYAAELLDADQRESNRVAFAPLTLEAVIEAIAAARASKLAQALWARYCDLDRVYRLSMQELVGGDITKSNITSPPDVPALIKPPLPPVRRRSSSSNRHRMKVTSSASEVAAKAITRRGAI